MTRSGGHDGPGACGQGPSSFGMQDPALVFKAMGLEPGMAFLDLGCGPGDYALAAARVVGPAGLVHAVDEWERMIALVRDRAREQGLGNVRAYLADMRSCLPVADACVDVCLLAMVLHYLRPRGGGDALWREVRRVLRPGGTLALLGGRKDAPDTGGPCPAHRWSPEECAALLGPRGFVPGSVTELGSNYLFCFRA